MDKLPYGTILRDTESDDWMQVASQVGLGSRKHTHYSLRCSDGQVRVLTRRKVETLIRLGRVEVSKGR